MNRLMRPVVAVALIASGFGTGLAVSATAANDTAPPPVTVAREALAEAPGPVGARNRTLGLSKVVVMPGARLTRHYHPGTQIGYIAEGTLTYTVETGRARLMSGPGDDATVMKVIMPGDTVKVRAGQWLIEDANARHHARNAGKKPIILYIASLFKTGAPAAIPD